MSLSRGIECVRRRDILYPRHLDSQTSFKFILEFILASALPSRKLANNRVDPSNEEESRVLKVRPSPTS